VEAYAGFVQGVTAQLNLKVAKAFAEECKHLRPLPACKVPAHTDMEVVVRKWSTIRVAKNTYMVSSRLIGHTVTARLRPDVVEVLYRDEIVECMPRLRGTGQHHVNYRCIIDSLVRKPGAFARYRYREDMFPTPQFRRAYAALCEFRGERADVQYVRILDLAAKTMESEVQVALELLVEQGKPFEYGDVKDLVEAKSSPRVEGFTALVVPDLSQYDTLMTGEYHERIAKGSEPVPDGTPPGALHVLQVAHGGP
jgi:hypothetical protein